MTWRLGALAIGLAVFGFAPAGAAAQAPVPDQYIVVLKSSADQPGSGSGAYTFQLTKPN